MITRKKYQPGYYSSLVNGAQYNVSDSQNIDDELIHHTKIKKKEINICHLIKLINYNILTKLKSNRKSSPTCIVKLNIEYKVFNYLKNNYQFNSRFKESKEFLSKHNIECERCQNDRYYSIASDFEFKINKGRTLKFNQRRNGKIISREITSNHTLTVSFFVKNFP